MWRVALLKDPLLLLSRERLRLRQRLLLRLELARRSDGPQLGIVLEKIFLELGEDVLAVRVLAQGVAVGPDLVHENLPLWRLRHIDHFLYHIVGVLILHHLVQWTLGSETIIHQSTSQPRDHAKAQKRHYQS